MPSRQMRINASVGTQSDTLAYPTAWRSSPDGNRVCGTPQSVALGDLFELRTAQGPIRDALGKDISPPNQAGS